MRDVRIVLPLEAVSPLLVGSSEPDPFADRPLRRRADGSLVVPGTSIAGVLRSAAERVAGVAAGAGACAVRRSASRSTDERPSEPCPCPICRLFGNVRPVDLPVAGPDTAEDDRKQGAKAGGRRIEASGPVRAHASTVVVRDAPLELPDVEENDRGRVFDSVAIDRATGTASDARRYDQEVAPPGTRLEVVVEARGADGGQLSLLAAAVRALAAGELALGASTASGLGSVHLAEGAAPRVLERDLDRPGTWISWACDDGADRGWTPVEEGGDAWLSARARGKAAKGEAEPLAWQLTLDLSLSSADTPGTLLVHDPVVGAETGFEFAHRRGAAGEGMTARSLRGVLRSQAERILRTLAPEEKQKVCCDPFGGESCAARRLERERRERERGERGAEGESGEEADEPRDDLCLACHLFGCEAYASSLRVRCTPLPGAPDTGTPDTDDDADGDSDAKQPFDHVGIDRFTGGAREGAKFDALARRHPAGSGPAYRVELARLRRPGEEATEGTADLGLLALVVKDLRDGRLFLGGGSSRGHGRLRLARYELDRPPQLPAEEDDGSDPEPSFEPPSAPSAVDDTLERCVTALHQRLESLRAGKGDEE